MNYTSGNNHFDTPVEYLPGVGPKSAKKLAKLGVETIGDLLYFFPRKYLDYSQTSKISDLIAMSKSYSAQSRVSGRSEEQQNQVIGTVRAKIVEIANKKTKRRGLTLTEAMVADDSGSLKIIWFNQPYLTQTLKLGREIILHGKVNWDYFNQTYSMESPDWAEKPKIVSVYRETDGINSRYLSKIIAKVSELASDIEEFLPDFVIKENGLLTIDQAVKMLHAPGDMAELERARDRMAFDELFMISLRGQVLKAEIEQKKAPVIKFDEAEVAEFIEGLPFELTGDQRKAASEIIEDLSVGKDTRYKMQDIPQMATLRANKSQESNHKNQNDVIPAKAGIQDDNDGSQIKSGMTTNKEIASSRKTSAFAMTEVKGDNLATASGGVPQNTVTIKQFDNGLTSPMNRLLNGDVGSGKTVVAAIAAYLTAKAGFKVLIMAPTEILANQHYESFKKMFEKYEIGVELVTSASNNQKVKTKNPKKGTESSNEKGYLGKIGMASGYPMVYIGTHALLHLIEPIENVGLVVVDEQHRFGVEQRAKLQKLSIINVQLSSNDSMIQRNNEKLNGNWKLEIEHYPRLVPHFLSMTATPIPRSLQLVLFGELNVSVIEEKPANRKVIKTRVVDNVHRAKAYDFIRAHVKAGRQIFVICPLIEDTSDKKQETNNSQNSKHNTQVEDIVKGDDDFVPNNLTMEQFNNQSLSEVEMKTVVGEYRKLSEEIFPDLRIGMLHGKMKSKEKDEVMNHFSNLGLDILVSTSVVEVGVDIPNATVMMIEDAERFGLAQLHQFRGRVGRSDHQSFCFLFSNSDNPSSLARLKRMEESSDGFELAEFDLKNRGAGDIFGTDQSGFEDIRFADLSNSILISKASNAAKSIIGEDAKLEKHDKIKARLSSFISSKHME